MLLVTLHQELKDGKIKVKERKIGRKLCFTHLHFWEGARPAVQEE
jgi:hypothetical protein